MYDFDSGVVRKGTNSVKWDMNSVRFTGEDPIPMWIADMDFRAPDTITNAIRKMADQAAYGYTFLSDEYYQAVISWMKRRHHFDVQKEDIIFMPGVNPGIDFAIQALAQPGDDILVEVPVYGPFYNMIKKNDCNIVETPLINDNEYYTFDWDDLESKITEKTKAFLLCSPHNPSGRVWTKEELLKLAEICERHDLPVICDEIHNDLIMEGEHTTFATLNEWTAMHTVTCTAPTKTFNLASILVSNIIIKDPELREKVRKITSDHHCSSASCFAGPVLIAAYNESEQWLDELLPYIRGNRDYLVKFIRENLPEIKIQPMQGTYLAWLNCEALGMHGDELKNYMSEVCGLAMNNGSFFGAKWDAYCRMNLACPRSTVVEACKRLEKGVKALRK